MALSPAVQEHFRRRALWTGIAVMMIALPWIVMAAFPWLFLFYWAVIFAVDAILRFIGIDFPLLTMIMAYGVFVLVEAIVLYVVVYRSSR